MIDIIRFEYELLANFLIEKRGYDETIKSQSFDCDADFVCKLKSRLAQMLGNKKKFKTVAEISLEYTEKYQLKSPRKEHIHEVKKRLNFHMKRNPATYKKKVISGVTHWGLKHNRNLNHYDTEEDEDENYEEEVDENVEEDEVEDEALSVEEIVEQPSNELQGARGGSNHSLAPVPTIASCSRVDSTPRTQEEEEEEEGYNSEDEYSHVGQTLSEAEWLEKDLSFDDTMEMEVQLSGEPDTDSSEPDNNRSDTPSPPPPEETEESDSDDAEAVRGYLYKTMNSFE